MSYFIRLAEDMGVDLSLWWCRFGTLLVLSICLAIIVSQVKWRTPIYKVENRYTTSNLKGYFKTNLQKNVENRTGTHHWKSIGSSEIGNILLRAIHPDRNFLSNSQTGSRQDSGIYSERKNVMEKPIAAHRARKKKLHVNPRPKDLDWLGNEGQAYGDYGDKSCEVHWARPIFKALMKRWIQIAQKLNLTYFLTCGTLLGAYRNSDLIPNDGDLDVLVDIKDYPKLARIAQKRNFIGDEQEFHFVLQIDFNEPLDERRRFSCMGKHVPAYMDHCSFQEPLGRLIREDYHLDVYHFVVKGDVVEDPSEGGRILQKSDIFPLRRCMFMNLETRCPQKPKSILNMLYGEDLKPLKVCKNGEWVEVR